MRRTAYIFLILSFATCLQAQNKLNPVTGVNWPLSTGSGAPAGACGAGNFGQPYTDTTGNVSYVCSSSGWMSVSGAAGQGYLLQPYANYTAGGTQLHQTACFISGQQVGVCPSSATSGFAGVTIGGANGTTPGNALVAVYGQAPATFDGTATAGDCAVASATAGELHDTGSAACGTSGYALATVTTGCTGTGCSGVAAVNVTQAPLNAAYASASQLNVGGSLPTTHVTIAPASTPPASWQLDVTTPATALGSIFSLTTTGSTGPATLSGTTLNVPQYAGGSVTSFAAPSASWPTWLVPTVTNPTTTPSLAVAASAIPNAALANSSTTVNGTTCTLGSTCSPTATTVNGASVPASAAALASNASSQVTAAPVTGTGTTVVLASAPTLSGATLDGTTFFTNGATTFATFNSTLSGFQLPSTGGIFSMSSLGIATSGTNYNSPQFQIQGDYWNGTAPSTDTWSFQDLLGTGANPSSTLTILHGGTTGTSVIKAPHIITAGTPVIGCSTGAGTSPSVCTVTGNDEAGIVNITTGTAPASSATIFTMSLGTPCTAMVYPVTQASNVNAASLTGNTHTYAVGSSASGWSMTSNATGLTASTAYAWTYITRCN